ncbi:MAG: PilZ domain-containing protein [Phycisphaerae bacterium]
MQEPNEKGGVVNRRHHQRWTVYNFLRATAILSKSLSLKEIKQANNEFTWTGLLVDVSEHGAQMIMPEECGKSLGVEQEAGLCIRTSLEETDFEVISKIKSVETIQGSNAVRINVQFVGLENNVHSKFRVKELCEHIDKLQASVSAT